MIKVLVVDDDVSARERLAEMLAGQGVEVRCVSRAEADPPSPPALVVSDAGALLRKLDETMLLHLETARALAREIAERTRLEAELEESEAVRRRAEQGHQSDKMRAIGTMAGGIAHDFNNILAVVLGNAEFAAMERNLSESMQTSIDEILKAGRRANQLVQQILTFNRSHAATLAVLELRPVVEEAARLLRASLPAGVQLKLSIAEDTPNVLAEKARLHQVLRNIGTNASHAFDGADCGVIDIRVDSVPAGDASSGPVAGRCARITIRDNGCGMDTDTQQRIFEPFFTTRPAGGGTGLGLATVHGIVRQLNGKIAVQSSPGEGTVFELLLPAATGETLPEKNPHTPPQAGNGQRILYIDDEEALVYLAVRMLNTLGYRASGFVRPEDALAALRRDPHAFDIVVTDYNMPQISGLHVAREVVQLRPDLPVMVTSGFITEELREKSAQIGVRYLVEKPDTMDGLCDAVRDVLDPSRR